MLLNDSEVKMSQGDSMNMSNAEKLIVWLLTEILKNQNVGKGTNAQSEDNLRTVDLIQGAICGGHLWVLEMEMPGIFHGGEPDDTEEQAREVSAILGMWRSIEEGFLRLTEDAKKRIMEEISLTSAPKFTGFDGNDRVEAYYCSIARFLVEKMGRYEYFKDRDFNSHCTMLNRYRKMLPDYQGERDRSGSQGLGAEAILRLLKLFWNK
jgi:uncharacterized protein YfbU (UPF0304 family)